MLLPHVVLDIHVKIRLKVKLDVKDGEKIQDPGLLQLKFYIRQLEQISFSLNNQKKLKSKVQREIMLLCSSV